MTTTITRAYHAPRIPPDGVVTEEYLRRLLDSSAGIIPTDERRRANRRAAREMILALLHEGSRAEHVHERVQDARWMFEYAAKGELAYLLDY